MRALALPLIAVVLVAAVLGVQVAAGGDDYVPRRPADPCAPRAIPPIPARLETVAERIVLLGLDGAACRLGVSRERLVLTLADSRSLDPDAAAALKTGLRDAVDRLDREGRLPKVSQLLPEALAQADLPGFVKTIIAAIPDRTVDGALPTGPLLRRAVDELDVGRLVRELDDPDQLESAVRSAILRAARDQILDRLRGVGPTRRPVLIRPR
jgi:hypothetical protein